MSARRARAARALSAVCARTPRTSAIFALQSAEISTFGLFTSSWTIDFAWRYLRSREASGPCG